MLVAITSLRLKSTAIDGFKFVVNVPTPLALTEGPASGPVLFGGKGPTEYAEIMKRGKARDSTMPQTVRTVICITDMLVAQHVMWRNKSSVMIIYILL